MCRLGSRSTPQAIKSRCRPTSPENGDFASIERAPDGEPIPFKMRDGVLHAIVERLDEFALIVATKA